MSFGHIFLNQSLNICSVNNFNFGRFIYDYNIDFSHSLGHSFCALVFKKKAVPFLVEKDTM